MLFISVPKHEHRALGRPKAQRVCVEWINLLPILPTCPTACLEDTAHRDPPAATMSSDHPAPFLLFLDPCHLSGLTGLCSHGL